MLDLRLRVYEDVLESGSYRFQRLGRAVLAAKASDMAPKAETGSRITGAVLPDRCAQPGPAAPVTGQMVEVVHAGVATTAGAAVRVRRRRVNRPISSRLQVPFNSDPARIRARTVG
jgi:hypothetical protein